MKICPLFSSSKGNCTYISDDTTSVLIDIGVPLRSFKRNMNAAGLSPEDIDAVFITHEHSDHIKGLNAFLKAYDIPVFSSKGTLNYLVNNGLIPPSADINIIGESGTEINSIKIKAFSTPHDSAESLGFRLELDNGYIAAVCTDLGHVSDTVSDNLLGADVVMIESNYDAQMLAYGRYPNFLKKRISGFRGHLSNEDCSNEILNLAGNATKHFILGHLSEENNRPELAYTHTVSKLTYLGLELNIDFDINIAPPAGFSQVFEYNIN